MGNQGKFEAPRWRLDEWLSCDLVLLLVLLLLRPWTGVCARLRGTLPLPTATRAHNRRSRSDMRRGRAARGMLSAAAAAARSAAPVASSGRRSSAVVRRTVATPLRPPCGHVQQPAAARRSPQPRCGRVHTHCRAFGTQRPDEGDAADQWQQYTDPATGNPYYFNVATQTTQWERPAVLGEQGTEPPPKTFTEQQVPSSPMQRVMGFAGLGINLAAGVGMEVARRASGGSADGGSALLSTRNSEVLAAELCRMRGAALKLGQMLSLQDESFLPAPLAEALKRVRTHADVMPAAQLEQVMSQNLGADWRTKFAHFGTLPVAAASIGQVHQAALHDGRAVAVKVQYPGVGQSIHSDLSNLETLLSVLRVAPPGLYLDRIIDVAREELAEECDYVLEAGYQSRFGSLLADDPEFVVPEVVQDLSTANVLTSTWVDGVPIDDDSVIALPQEDRDRLALALLRLCLREVFEFRLVQTDPNWSNFLYDHANRKFILLDFGATRPLSEEFSSVYLELVWAAANADRDQLIEKSIKLGFLTGQESQTMLCVPSPPPLPTPSQ